MQRKNVYYKYLKKYQYDDEFLNETLKIEVAELLLKEINEQNITLKELSKRSNLPIRFYERILECDIDLTLKQLVCVTNALKKELVLSFKPRKIT